MNAKFSIMSEDWNNSTNELQTNDKSSDLKTALSAIAQELQRFYTPQTLNPREVKSDEIFAILNMVKSKLSTKNRHIKKLRKNFKSAYVVARSVMSVKDNENAYLSKHVQLTKDQCDCLLQKNKLSSKEIDDLKSEGQSLKNEMEAIEVFINLGYTELQKMRNMPVENITVMRKLREIMVSCGQYYSDYYNENEKRLQLEQKIRFLTNKISILTNSEIAKSKELDNMRTQKMRLQAENEILKKKQNNPKPMMSRQESYHTLDDKSKSISDPKYTNNPINLNFSSHLTTIKKLLDDQDDMLKSLKKISEELTISDNFCL